MSEPLQMRGLFPAPSVPFDDSMNIVEHEFTNLIEEIGQAPSNGGVLINAHAGELAVLTATERRRVLELTREALPSDQVILSGVDGLALPTAIETLKEAKDWGAHAALVFPPFDYNPRRKLTRSPEAPVRYYSALAEAVDLPLVVYQFPEASGVAYTTETLLELAEIDSVIAVKDTTVDGQLYQEHWEALQGKIAVLTALDTPDLLGHMLLGCDGAIIGVGQIAPALWGQYVQHILANESQEAIDVFKSRLLPLVTHIFFGRFDTPASESTKAKEALVQMGVFSTSFVRPPELSVTDLDREHVRVGLERAGLL